MVFGDVGIFGLYGGRFKFLKILILINESQTLKNYFPQWRPRLKTFCIKVFIFSQNNLF